MVFLPFLVLWYFLPCLRLIYILSLISIIAFGLRIQTLPKVRTEESTHG
jgi:hypothetical protein